MANTKPEGTVNALESKSITNKIEWYGTPEEFKKKKPQSEYKNDNTRNKPSKRLW
jgi:hypothetical protein